MELLRIDIDKIKYLNAFEKYTGIKTIECFKFNNALVYVVNPALLKIIMTKRSKIKELSKFLNKPIKILAFPLEKNTKNIEKFLNSLIYPNKIRNVQIRGNHLIIYSGFSKAILLGKEKKNIEILREVMKRYFGIEELEIR